MPSNFKKDWYDIGNHYNALIFVFWDSCFGMRVIIWIMVPIMCDYVSAIAAIIGLVTSVCNVYVNNYYVQSWLG